jgi:hypothetical protein
MPIQATVILDSGCFIPLENDGAFTEIGYFQSSDSISDIRVIVDGKEMFDSEPLNLGKKCKVEVRHVKANGKVVKGKPVGAYGFHDKLLHLKDVYGKDMPIDETKFDCILHFDTGLFCAAMVKPRAFRKHNKPNGGKLAMMADEKPKQLKKAIAHNVHVLFKLQKGDALELARNGEVFWSSKDSGAKDRIELEVVADNTTSEKFYVGALKEKQLIYWMPNNGDPPPMCPEPPCHPSAEIQ